MAKICVICNEKIGALTGKVKLMDGGYICKKCFTRAGFSSGISDIQNLQSMTSEQIKRTIPETNGTSPNLSAKDIQKNRLEYFKNNSNLKIADILFNDKDQALLIKKSALQNRAQNIIKYNEIESYTPIFLGGKIKKHHGITRAVVGGFLAGPIGALVGVGTGGKEWESINRLGIELFLKDNRIVKYDLISTETKIDSLTGKTSFDQYNHLVSKLDSILSSHSKDILSVRENSTDSTVNDIRKYKELLDEGIISQQEFDEKKADLLNK